MLGGGIAGRGRRLHARSERLGGLRCYGIERVTGSPERIREQRAILHDGVGRLPMRGLEMNIEHVVFERQPNRYLAEIGWLKLNVKHFHRTGQQACGSPW